MLTTPISLLIAQDELDRATRFLRIADVSDEYNDDEARIQRSADRAEVAIWRGDLAAARTAIADAVALADHSERPVMLARACRLGLRCEADTAEQGRRRGDRIADAAESSERGRQLLDLVTELLSRPGHPDGWKRLVNVEASVAAAEWTRLIGEPSPPHWAAATAEADELALAELRTYSRVRAGEAHLALGADRTEATNLIKRAHAEAEAIPHVPLSEFVERIARRGRIDIGAGYHADEPFGLTSRERDVLDLVAVGSTNRSIAQTLFISEKTASVHVSNIIRKMNVSNRSAAAAIALQHGLNRD